MRTLRELFRLPRGWSADGRTLGLGLAVAMDKQRQEATRGVEDYLRHTAADGGDRSATTTSA